MSRDSVCANNFLAMLTLLHQGALAAGPLPDVTGPKRPLANQLSHQDVYRLSVEHNAHFHEVSSVSASKSRVIRREIVEPGSVEYMQVDDRQEMLSTHGVPDKPSSEAEGMSHFIQAHQAPLVQRNADAKSKPLRWDASLASSGAYLESHAHPADPRQHTKMHGAAPLVFTPQPPVQAGPYGIQAPNKVATPIKQAELQNTLPVAPKVSTKHQPTFEEAVQAEQKFENIVAASEKEAGLPDTTHTTPAASEVAKNQPGNEEKKENLTAIIALSVVGVLLGIAVVYSCLLVNKHKTEADELRQQLGQTQPLVEKIDQQNEEH